MNETVFKLTLGFGLLALAATEVSAQSANCAPRAMVIERLADTYGESRQSIGLGGEGQIVETFASAETGTWTITVTLPSGITCLVASGQAYETLAEALPNTDDDA
ncbi:hypothetical protein [Aestuariivita boseongensis]|uniref:hypothetical protein n=1 Tax=Aestuariivita boseongensis TaxID=1470562 RepID=UPI00068099F9|nr:hypothetical protein [Aestuariivita boseongensis]